MTGKQELDLREWEGGGEIKHSVLSPSGVIITIE